MKILRFLACSFLICAAAHAAPPSKESIEKLLVDMQVEKLLVSTQKQLGTMMQAGISQAFKGQTLTPEQKRLSDSLVAKIVANMQDDLSWDKMKDLYIQVYSETFSQEEIDGLISFYETPAGKAYVDKMPVVMQKTMTLMQQRMGPMIQKMQRSVQETVREVQAANEKTPDSTSEPASATPSKP